MVTANNLTLLVSPDGRDNSLSINQDAFLYKINPTQALTEVELDPHHCQFLQVTEGSCSVDGQELQTGDMVYIEDESQVMISGSGGELLYFNLPRYSA